MESTSDPEALAPGAQRIVQSALEMQARAGHSTLGVRHWLLALLQLNGGIAETVARGIRAAETRVRIQSELEEGEGAALPREEVLREAGENARGRGQSRVFERDVAAVILKAAGYEIDTASPASAPSASAFSPPRGGRQDQAEASRPTPTLKKFGRDLTREAHSGALTPVVGRDQEIELVIETLCRRTKRNPVLVGPAGVGKTAIVEGLAQRIAAGKVPEPLRQVRLIAVQPSTMVAGASVVGELEKRMTALIEEASHPGIILFVDEVHSIVGAGGAAGSGDMASLLKPALARGQLACIAATTDDEYRQFIEKDAALERRFQPVRVQELTLEQTLGVLRALRDDLSQLRGVNVPDEVLRWLVDFAQQFLPNRNFPDKGVDLLEQSVAYAVAQGKQELALVDAEHVVQRMVGMPLALADRLETLKHHLRERAVLPESAAGALVGRLNVSLRGLDLRSGRPNAVVLLAGAAAGQSAPLAESIAGALFGAAERVVTIDFSRFTEDHHVSMLIGAPPGYVGYSDSLPLHRVAQMPWCVLRCENVHACHPKVRELLTQALAEGYLTDTRGKRIFLSDTVVVATCALRQEARRSIGFRDVPMMEEDRDREAAEDVLGPEFVAQVDVLATEAPQASGSTRQWLENELLATVSARYRKRGLDVSWDPSFLRWLEGQAQEGRDATRQWERIVDEHVGAALIPHLPIASEPPHRVLVRSREGNMEVLTHAPEPRTGD